MMRVQWGLSDLQTAYSTLLLPCQSMSGSQMSCTFLSEHQTKIKATAVAAEAARGRYDEAEDGSNEREDEPEHEQPQRRQHSSKRPASTTSNTTTGTASGTTTTSPSATAATPSATATTTNENKCHARCSWEAWYWRSPRSWCPRGCEKSPRRSTSTTAIFWQGKSWQSWNGWPQWGWGGLIG